MDMKNNIIINSNYKVCTKCEIYWNSKIHESCPCCEYADKLIELLDKLEKKT